MSFLEDAKNLRDLAVRNAVILRHFDARLKPDQWIFASAYLRIVAIIV
jgi:hypothetical protein